jgi:L-lysine exporter family protein LysE/ArgO
MTAYISGFALGLSLILAIGAQNAFVLKQGLKKQHVFLVCSLCAFSDAILITFGVLGFSTLIEQYPWVEKIARYGGAIFLIVYAAMSFYSAYSQTHSLIPSDNAPESALKVTLIDAFTLGAVSASFVFFYSLGFGSRFLIPVFEKPRAWQILEVVIGVMMLTLAIKLLLQ